MANNLDLRIFDDKEIVPNGKLEDLVKTAVKLFDSGTLKGYRVCCYVFFGITDLLDVKQSQGYREVILRAGGDTLLLSKVDWAVRTLKDKGVMTTLCTFPPMSFAKHNQFLLKNGLTGKLEFKSQYQNMQSKLNEQVATINKRIEELNCDSGVVTCQLAAKLFVQERGRHILKDVYLRDGLHPTSQGAILLNVELAQNLRKAKLGKRSPEWLKKSHQIKSGSKISFGIKLKKDEPTLPSSAKVLEEKQSSSVENASSAIPESKSRSPQRLAKGSSPDNRRISRRSRSPRRRDSSPRRRDSSPRRRDLSPRRRNHSPLRRSRSPKHSGPQSKYQFVRTDYGYNKPATESAKRELSPAAEPKYKSVPVPKSIPALESNERVAQPLDKKQGSFALSAFLGSLSNDKDDTKDSASEASMSMSPPGPEPDPDIVVISDETIPRPSKRPRKSPTHRDTQKSPTQRDTRKSPTQRDTRKSPARRDARKSPTHSDRGQDNYYSRRRSRSRSPRLRSRRRSVSRGRHSPRLRSHLRSRSRSRRRSGSRGHRPDSRSHRRSRSLSRRQSQDRYRAERGHALDSLISFGDEMRLDRATRLEGSVMETRGIHDDPRFGDQTNLLRERPSTLLGNRPSDLLGSRPDHLLGQRPGAHDDEMADNDLVRLAHEHEDMTGRNTFGQIETLSNLNVLSAEGQDSSMKRALLLQKQALAQKMSGSIEQQKNKVFKMIEAEKKKNQDPFEQMLSEIQAQSKLNKSATASNYGYGFATQFQPRSSQPDLEPWQRESGYTEEGAESYDMETYRNRYDMDSNRGGYGGYE